jgi:hypothetical protein
VMRKRTKVCLVMTGLIPIGFLGMLLGQWYRAQRVKEAFAGGRGYIDTVPWPWYVSLARCCMLIGLFFAASAIAFLIRDYLRKPRELR